MTINLITNNVPKNFFVWVDESDWVVNHNLNVVKRFCSSPLSEPMFIPNPNFNVPFTSPFHNNLLINYKVEYNLEVDRLRWFSNYPSRLQSIFLLPSENDAYSYQKEQPEHTKNRKLRKATTEGYYTYSFHDASWVDFLRLKHSLDTDTINNVSKNYWLGKNISDCELYSLGKGWTKKPVKEILFLGNILFK